MKIVLVEWVDSSFAHGWMDRDAVNAHKISKCISVGLLVSEKEEQITIMLSTSKEQYGDGLTIPKCSIKQMWRLKVE